MPALAVMLVVVTAAAAVIESGQEASLRLVLLAAATYTSNWYQILHHVPYFAAAGLGRELVLVNTFGPQAWEHSVNTTLAAAARHGKHTELANWHQAIAARPALLWPDDIHPRPSGARLYARVVLTAIKVGLTSSQPSCRPPPAGSA